MIDISKPEDDGRKLVYWKEIDLPTFPSRGHAEVAPDGNKTFMFYKHAQQWDVLICLDEGAEVLLEDGTCREFNDASGSD